MAVWKVALWVESWEFLWAAEMASTMGSKKVAKSDREWDLRQVVPTAEKWV